jgi:hypothetical protein
MAERDKTEHISESTMERFCMRALTENELTTVARHLTGCPDCQAEFVSTIRRQRQGSDLSFTLAPEFWLRHEHLDYEQLVHLADNKLEETDRELIDVHMKVCPSCREDVRSFLAFREQIAPEMKVSYAPVEQESASERLSWTIWWGGLAWKPVYSAAAVILGIALVIGAALLLNRRADNQQAQQVPAPQATPGSTPNVSANLPSPTASPNQSPEVQSYSADVIVELNDGARTVTVNKSGNISGLDDVPAPTRDEIASVLLTEQIDPPAILKNLAGQQSALRGSNTPETFKLMSPTRTVVVSDRPTFKWENVSGASAYRVYINDPSGQIAARSDDLPPDRTEWLAPKPLTRGEIYAWTVTAVVDGKEIVAPGPSAPEMKFQVLSAANLQQLNRLKRARSHLALAVFTVRVGMLDEAEHEFTELSRFNPKAQVLGKLLHRVRGFSGR